MTRLAPTLIVCFAVAIGLATAAVAETRRFGNLIYDVPADFKKGRDDQGYVVLYGDTDKLKVYPTIRIYAGAARPEKLTLSQWANRQMDADLKADEETIEKKLAEEPVKVRSTPALMLSRVVKDRGKDMQVYVALDLGARFELIRFDASADDADDVKASADLIKTRFLPMLDKLQAVSRGAEPLTPPAKAGELHGVYWGGSLQSSIGMDGMMRLDFVRRTLTFYRDGRFLEGVPEAGVSQFDFNAAVATQTGDVGHYYLVDGKLTLRFADGESEEIEFKDGVVVDGAARLTKCRVPDDGFRFAGTRTFVYYSGFAPGAGQGGVSAYNSTTFRADGTYEHDQGSGASASFPDGGGFATHSKGGHKGKYTVKDGFVELKDDNDKTVKRWTIFLSEGEEDGKKKTYILVDGDFVE